MTTTKRTVSVRLDDAAAVRLERAARLSRQSRGAFLEQAGDESARRVLREWATSTYRRGERSLSELAAETSIAVEEIVEALGTQDCEAALAMFLASSQTVAEAEKRPEFLRLAREAAEWVREAGK